MKRFSQFFSRPPTSAEIAKGRLKLVLSFDRSKLTPELLDLLQDDLVRAISQHVDIDRDGMRITTQRGENGGDRLIADIPIRAVRGANSD